MISGLLMAGELVKNATGMCSPLETSFQIDSFVALSNTPRRKSKK